MILEDKLEGKNTPFFGLRRGRRTGAIRRVKARPTPTKLHLDQMPNTYLFFTAMTTCATITVPANSA